MFFFFVFLVLAGGPKLVFLSFQMHKKKILEVSFLDQCISEGRLQPIASFVIPDFEVDVESKFAIAHGAPSDLDPRVQALIQDLFDQKQIDKSLVDMGLDVRKMKLITEVRFSFF